MTSSESIERVALDNCDKEPVHIPRRIQSFASMMGFSLDDYRITYVSENLDELFGRRSSELIDLPTDEILSSEIRHAVRGAIGLPTISQYRERVGTYSINDKNYDVACHVTDGNGVIEFEKLHSATDGLSQSLGRLRTIMLGMNTGDGLANLINSAVRSLRTMTGFDRVMGYKFLANGDGEVVAEACSPAIEPYLGLRYPAADIPQQVRDIALVSPFRIIADIHDPHVNLLSNQEHPLDLTRCHSRGVSPIHIEYLNNMGVQATMNVSIIVNGRLWGLFAFHHYSRRQLHPEQRTECELFGQLFSLQLQQELEKEVLSRKQGTSNVCSRIRSAETNQLNTVVNDVGPQVKSLVGADGLALVHNEEIYTSGSVPGESVIRNLSDIGEEFSAVVNSLKEHLGSDSALNEKVAGALILRCGHASTRLILFRDEIIEHVRWGGEPNKNIEFGPNDPRLTPRSSFQEYQEQVRGRCEEWTRSDIEAAGEIRSAFVDLLFDEMVFHREELQRKRQFQDLMIAELNHRVKNILALTRSIATQTHSHSESIAKFIETFQLRITALATAHDLIGGSSYQWPELEQLFRMELRPYLSTNRKIHLVGPSVGIRADIAPMISLMIHELVTNAAKYGAIADSNGQISIEWESDELGIRLTWRETVSKPISPPTRRGFGLSLIERAIAHESGGSSKLEFTPEGLRAEFSFPMEIVRISEQQKNVNSDVKESDVNALIVPSDAQVLLVEDNFILALEMEKILDTLGFADIATFSRTEDALKWLEKNKPQIGILDVNLGGSTSFGLADSLQNNKIPILFVTGYGDSIEFPANLEALPRLPKPVDKNQLINTLRNYFPQESY